MSDDRLRELERRWRETGAPEDERAWLRGRLRAVARLDWASYQRACELDPAAAADYLGKRVGPKDLRLAARLGSATAALSLGQPAAPTPHVFQIQGAAALGDFFGSWEPALVYLRAALCQVLEWWLDRGPEYRESIEEFEPTLTAIRDWFYGERGEKAGQTALVWARSAPARAQLLAGRFEREGRALRHLAYAWGGLAYICAPIGEPFRKGSPTWPSSRGGGIANPDGIRLERVTWIRHEAFEAIKGTMYERHPVLDMMHPDYGPAIAATLAPFEEFAAEALVRWLLSK
ncbi:MAG: hypothetical protein JKY65_27800 [Planctomycetes bacterium]|nr:hypothetical protein [Planctomycetota bacterium]